MFLFFALLFVLLVSFDDIVVVKNTISLSQGLFSVGPSEKHTQLEFSCNQRAQAFRPRLLGLINQ